MEEDMSAIKPYSHKVAEVYENGAMQRRVVLTARKTTSAKIRKEILTRLYKEVEKVAELRRENVYHIELKYQ
jgi:hypothetical protein